MKRDLPKLIVSIVGCELAGILGTPFTIAAIPTWYEQLLKPFFAPPKWVFGPVWTLLYLLMGVSFYLILKMSIKKKAVREAIKSFLIQLFLNFLWTIAFFGLRSPLLGFIVILLMLSFIILTMKKFYPLSKTACYLLAPYVLWVSFATLLNLGILLLN